MGFCMHIEGVECDNCRGNRRYSQPHYPVPYPNTPPTPIPHIITTTGTAPLPYTVPANLMNTIEEIRRELKMARGIEDHLAKRVDELRKEVVDVLASVMARLEKLEGKTKPKKAKPKARRSRK